MTGPEDDSRESVFAAPDRNADPGVPQHPGGSEHAGHGGYGGITVQTVTGRVPVDRLGWTLPHEHILMSGAFQAPGLALVDVELAAAELADAFAIGTRTVIDATPFDLNRRPRDLVWLSQTTGMQIVMGSSWYLHKTYPERLAFASTRSLTDELLKDIGEGCEGIRPGVIGEMGTWSASIEAREERVIRAAGRAQLASGMPIILHQQRQYSGGAVLEILGEEGVDPKAVVLGHTDSIPDRAGREAAVATGAWLGFDRLQGWELVHQLSPFETDRRVRLLQEARAEGYLGRVLLDTDCCVVGDLRRFEGPGYCYTHGDFAATLSEAGFTADELEMLFRTNPARMFTVAFMESRPGKLMSQAATEASS